MTTRGLKALLGNILQCGDTWDIQMGLSRQMIHSLIKVTWNPLSKVYVAQLRLQ